MTVWLSPTDRPFAACLRSVCLSGEYPTCVVSLLPLNERVRPLRSGFCHRSQLFRGDQTEGHARCERESGLIAGPRLGPDAGVADSIESRNRLAARVDRPGPRI